MRLLFKNRNFLQQEGIFLSRPRTIPRYRKPYMYPVAMKDEAVPVEAVEQSRDTTLYTEPFVRAFLLGIGSAGILETANTVIHAFTVNSVRPFQPLFYADHVTAILGWLVFYLIDVLAIKNVLATYKNDAAGANLALQQLVTLPQRMLPFRLHIFKHIYPYQPPASFTSTVPSGVGYISPSSTTVAAQPAIDSESTPKNDAIDEYGIQSDSIPKAQNVTRGSTNILPTPSKLGERRSRQGLAPGEMDPSVSEAFARRRQELADRRGYLYGFWYAAALSESVKPGVPLGVDILSQRVVLFRDSITGKIQVLDDVCPHRGAPLSEGWIGRKDGHDCVVCPYHGWAFSGDGRLRDVPAAECSGEWPHRQIVPVYDAEERGGFVWLWYGPKDLPHAARPAIPVTIAPELEDPQWKAVYGEITFNCNHSSVFENAIDMAHIHYLHSDSFGNQDAPQIRDMQCSQDPSALSITATFKLTNKPASPLWEWTKLPEVSVTARAFLPSTSIISFTLGNGLSFSTFVNTVPISPDKSINRFALIRNLAWDKTGTFNAGVWDSWARTAMMKILGEDKVMVERLRPELLSKEYSVRADLPQVHFRKLRQRWVDLGYIRRVDGTPTTAMTSRKNSDTSDNKNMNTAGSHAEEISSYSDGDEGDNDPLKRTMRDM